MATAPDHTTGPGILLPNGSRVIHGSARNIRPAFPPETNIPGTLYMFNSGAAAEPSTPTFRGAMGYFPFDTSMRMPRHVHISTGPGPKRFLVEKVITISGVGLAELGGEVYVIPPLTMVLIAPGCPHTWSACPAGVDLKALGVADEDVLSDGTFAAVFEYEDATTFYPTAQRQRLESVDEYVACEDLQSIRLPEMEAKDVVERAWFVWGRSVSKLDSKSGVDIVSGQS